MLRLLLVCTVPCGTAVVAEASYAYRSLKYPSRVRQVCSCCYHHMTDVATRTLVDVTLFRVGGFPRAQRVAVLFSRASAGWPAHLALYSLFTGLSQCKCCMLCAHPALRPLAVRPHLCPSGMLCCSCSAALTAGAAAGNI